MKFEYTGRHMDVTPTLRAHVEDHFSKIDHIFNDSTARAHVIIEVEKNRHIGEIILNWRDHTLTATDTNADMYQALTRVIAKIEKQAIKLKKKIIERRHNATPISALPPSDDQAEVASAASNSPRIIAARSYSVKPMTAEEAALRLSDDSNQFLVFRDADTNSVGVLYKRKDGNFGLIEP